MKGRRWHLDRSRRGVAPIIGTILLIAMTVAAGALLWSFRLYQPPSPPNVTFLIRSGGSNPVWGDGTDTPSSNTYSLLNTTQIIIATHSPENILLSDIQLTFICDNLSSGGNETILLQGSLADMTWFPGVTGSGGAAPAGSPTLGWCASFHAGGYGGSYDTAYNRLGLFVPISTDAVTVLENGDTFLLYIHNGGYPLDYNAECGGSSTKPVLDCDDYHGAPPWCFTNQGACEIVLTYTGSPSTTLATIPVYSLAPPTSSA